MSVTKKAKVAAGRARCCKCSWWNGSHCVDPAVATVCYNSFIKGYQKGYNQRKTEEYEKDNV